MCSDLRADRSRVVGIALRKGCQQRIYGRVIAESLANVNVAVYVTGSKHEAPAQLKRIGAQAMLPEAALLRAPARLRVVGAKHMQNVGRLETRGTIGAPIRINQQRKRDAGLLAKQAGVASVAKTDSGEIGALGPEFVFMVAQLRNMLAAKDSTVMTQEHDNGGTAFP